MNAHKAMVRMLFDPAFADAVRANPDAVLADLTPALRAQLAALDDRALRVDRLRRRRALRTLCEEWKATTTLALAETGKLGMLEAFFSTAHFHGAVDERGSMPLAFAAFLAELVAGGVLRTRILPEVLSIETAMAVVRRAPADPPIHAFTDESRVTRSAGAYPLKVAAGAMAAITQVDRYLFEVGLMPAVALCDDAPRLMLDAKTADATPVHLVVVQLAQGPSLVTIDPSIFRVLSSLSTTPRTVAAVLSEARARGVADPRPILASLVDDELAFVA